MSPKLLISDLEEVEKNRRKACAVNRLFAWALPILLVGAGVDLSRWASHSTVPLEPVRPNHLAFVEEPLALIPPLELSGASFHPVESEKLAEKAPAAVAEEVHWKLKGVLLGASKRAFLEGDGGRTVWVTDGEWLGAVRVKEIRERSVLLEKGGAEVELRM